MKERLQKLISSAGLMSRRAAEALLREGRVSVNGAVAGLGDSADPATDAVTVDGAVLRFGAARTYVMLHKPRGYVSTRSDERGRPTVAQLVADTGARLYPVGRLDMDSEGLLLLTDDGALTQALTHPSHEVHKVYRTTVRGNVNHALPVLRGPMVIDGYSIRPAQVTQVAPDVLDITIHEGRNRQVRKMCAQAGLEVQRLVRVAEGPLTLGDLPTGQWRFLRPEELAALRALL